MIIATSGYSYINYNRIISSSIPPYVDASLSKTFRDPTSNSNRILFGLHIIDQNNAVSLINDYSNQATDLATINFLTLKISYQRVFPLIYNMQTAVFTSPTVYYAGGYNTNFYTDQTLY